MTGNGGCTSDTGEEALETAFTSKDGSRRETYPIVFCDRGSYDVFFRERPC